MLTPILAKLPGSVFLQALMDGEPVAFVMLGGVITLLAIGFTAKYIMSQVE